MEDFYDWQKTQNDSYLKLLNERLNEVNEPVSEPLFVRPISEAIPMFTYVGLGIGLLSHLVNIAGTSAGILDITYFTTIGGYGVATAGLGVGLYQATQPKQQLSIQQDLMPKVHAWKFAFEF